MSWMDQLGGLLQQYTGAGPHQAPHSVHDDFDQFAQAAPQSALAEGVAAAFRSDQTPPFASMVGQLFGQSSGAQRAGLLNTLIGAAGPAVVGQLLTQRGLGGLAGMFQGGPTQMTPQQAEQIPPQVVEEIAAHAEQQNPSIIDTLGDFYARNPALVKTLGGAALTIALAQLAQRRR